MSAIWTEERKKDFADQYYANVPSEIREKHFGISKGRLRELELTFGLRSPGGRVRRCPDDFKEIYETIGSIAARTHYRTGWDTIVRWRIETGLSEDLGKGQVPEGWAEIAPTMTARQLCVKYRLTPYRLTILIAQTGVTIAKPVGRKPFMPKTPPPEAIRVVEKAVDPQRADKAAHHLRRFYPAVHRCDLKMYVGRNTVWADMQSPPIPNHGVGYYWVSGRGALRNPEMIELAISKGFNG